ncbi:4-methylaminobutanoate oxidase (formaldehyde-forming) (plasmid) [Pseudoseohaeicola sp. NH-UV-7]|uniref:NAD(P)/FAD-dependent oxidoreductase n=1 Tax=unclassified Sulfitobacter TaxID=196795 RepID=UPI000E09EFDB|nr:FAD-binding oxidoreductase [Sulfitobacter sp. JL08]AXI56075.1 D-amino-acid oxidase [Sulfitobacter sp. JL08]
MPGPTPTAVIGDTQLPKRVDVVVIGGGIIGAMAALELVERGISVALCEKGEIGAEQSSRNWGWVRMAGRDAREIPLMDVAIQAWQGMDKRLGRKTGYTRTGSIFAASSDRIFSRYQDWTRNLTDRQMTCHMVSAADLEGLLPRNNMQLAGAMQTPMDGRAEPQWAAPAIAEAARDAGAHVLTGCAVRTVETSAGAVSGVVTEKGEIGCQAVVLAGGAWSRLFAGNAGIELPQLKVLNSVLRTTPIRDGPDVAFRGDKIAFRKHADGGYIIASREENVFDLVPDSFRLARAFFPALRAEWKAISFRLSDRWWQEARMKRHWRADDTSPFETCRILDPVPSAKARDHAWTAARAAFPFLQGVEIAQSWAGLIDVTPDAIPVISPVTDRPGLYIATGFSGHGFGIAPGAGRLVADLITGAPPTVDPHDFRLSRFSDGSKTVLETGY